SASRCTSGQPIPGEVPLNAFETASSEGLNGNTNETTSSTVFTPPDTALAGTSATNATGSDTSSAISDAADTSRAIPPIVTPIAPNASPPQPTASTHSSKRPHSMCTNSDTAAAITSVTAAAQ